MTLASWAAFVGLLLIVMSLSTSLVARLPLSTSMLYLGVGAAASPWALGWTALSPAAHSSWLEPLAEIVVLLSLFTSGLKMSLGLVDGRWLLPVRLASASMLVTVGLITLCGVTWLGLSLGAAILLGGILAPTDPVLASEVQLSEPGDRDRLRFALTGEAGLNDGTAFPFVLLGLGLLGLHELGNGGSRWLALDVVWGVAGGIGIGALLGTLIGQFVLYLRSAHGEAVGLDNFLALGLIGLSYGLAGLAHTLGFLAVFSAGVALRRVEQRARPRGKAAASATVASGHADPDVSSSELAVNPATAPAFMAHAVLGFNEQVERIGEVAAVVAIGMLLWAVDWRLASWSFVAVVMLIVRPVSVAVGLAGSRTSASQRTLIAWFGIRGIGSLYYLMYATSHGVDAGTAATLAALTLSVVAVSITAHGISVTPLMGIYARSQRRARGKSVDQN
jgi:NhaP-type Na+/H+ or K+/H+ antiporter